MSENLPGDGKPPSILVVDDDYQMRHALSQALTHGGYNVTVARDGADGLAKFDGQEFGIVITDLRMPKVDGMEVLRTVKERSPDTAVVVVTAFGDVEEAVEAMRRGADEFLVKPFPIQKLEEVVKRILWRKRGRPQPVITLGGVGKKLKSRAHFLCKDPRTKEVEQQALVVAATDATVLITGESGTGKELLARLIHRNSRRQRGPFVAVNCAALNENLLESELFGHEKGAFTGAVAQREGKFELANKGTLLLDEISEMQTSLQAKLLRAIQEREIDRIGGRSPIPMDVRIVTTTNKDLRKEVEAGRFREDLYYRLKVVTLTIPPLRERKDDIVFLAEFFLKDSSQLAGREITGFAPQCVEKMLGYPWPGNIRELENAIIRAVIFCAGDKIGPSDMDLEGSWALQPSDLELSAGLSVREMEKRLILKTLEATKGNRTKAAKMLDVSLRTIRNKLRLYREEEGISIPLGDAYYTEVDRV
ncbi:MAG: sigma-54-dependent Fis family transcriptional regulator [Nitrospinae bacterium]|nr:sigma-54-dependent Fis family transcriptional regulator [Nitrospinota bacterium]